MQTFPKQSWHNRGIWSMFDVSLGEVLDMKNIRYFDYLGVQFHEVSRLEQMNYPLDFVGMELFGIPKEALYVVYIYIYMCVCVCVCVCVQNRVVYWGNGKALQNCMVLRVFGFQQVESFLKRDSVNRTQIHQTWAKTHNAYPDRNSSKALTSSFLVQASDRFCFSYFIYFDTRTLHPPLPVGCFLLARSPTIPVAWGELWIPIWSLAIFHSDLEKVSRAFCDEDH